MDGTRIEPVIEPAIGAAAEPASETGIESLGELGGELGSELAGEPTSERRWPPGDLALWIFILAELSVFAAFFAAYAFARAAQPALFDAAQQTLNPDTAYINTIALITSSWFVVKAVAAIRADDARRCARWLWAAFAFGGLFILVKATEYAEHIGNGITLSTNLFYMFYLSLTFFHFMHVLLGMVILAAVALRARAGAYSAAGHDGVESGASYWHMVDLVWLILFPLVYVMR